MSSLSPFQALKTAVARAGGQSAFARALGITQGSVWKWLQSSKRLPGEHVLATEAKFGVSRSDLRPDLYPRGLQDGLPWSDELDPEPAHEGAEAC